MRLVIPVLISVLLFCSPIYGGTETPDSSSDQSTSESREEELKAKRLARKATTKPAKPSRVPAILATAENDGFDQLVSFQIRHFRIGFGKISPVSGLTPGIQYERPRLGHTELTLRTSGAYSLSQYQVYDFQLGVFEFPAPYDFLGDGLLGAPYDFDQRSQEPMKGMLYADFRYRNFPAEEFFGLGPGSSEDDRTNYRFEEAAIDLVGGYHLARWIAVQTRAGYLTTHVGRSPNDDRPDTQDLFDDADAPGVESQPDFFNLDSGLYFSWEGDPNLPAAVLGLRYSRFDDRGGSQYQFNRYSADARGFLPLGSRQRILAARFYASHDDADSGSEVPFYLMKTLGGQDTLRGFRNFRFRDNNLLYLSAEYRWEANPAVQLAVFYDTGKVFSDGSDFDFNHLEHGIGGGIRFKSMRRTVFRIDVGNSDEGTFVYISLGPSF